MAGRQWIQARNKRRRDRNRMWLVDGDLFGLVKRVTYGAGRQIRRIAPSHQTMVQPGSCVRIDRAPGACRLHHRNGRRRVPCSRLTHGTHTRMRDSRDLCKHKHRDQHMTNGTSKGNSHHSLGIKAWPDKFPDYGQSGGAGAGVADRPGMPTPWPGRTVGLVAAGCGRRANTNIDLASRCVPVAIGICANMALGACLIVAGSGVWDRPGCGSGFRR